MLNTPYDIIAHVRELGVKKYRTSIPKLIVLGILAGCYIGMGCLLASYSASGLGDLARMSPILPKLLAGATFPLGLMLVVLLGAELFTGNTAYLIPATIAGDIPRGYFLKNWFIIYLSNFLGALAFSYFLAYETHVLSSSEAINYLYHQAEVKLNLSFSEAFWRGVGANWLVCLAVWLGFSSRSMLGRLAGIWWPVMAFVTLGFEHSVANMFYIPTAIFYGYDTGLGDFILNNLLPSTVGNITGGALFVGVVYTLLFRSNKH